MRIKRCVQKDEKETKKRRKVDIEQESRTKETQYIGVYGMKNLGVNEIREKYLRFFEEKGHLKQGSYPITPQNEASLLFINSGMAPLKPFFSGKEIPPKNRMTTCQKCVRTPDIDNVGKTDRHFTFFEMLGNFSFGDYFKEEAITWAWEFVTKELELPQDRLYVTVFKNDDESLSVPNDLEAYRIWNEVLGLSKEKIFEMGTEDNFWEIGTGPCGPCSEIYFDRGVQKGCQQDNCWVGCSCDRFIEIWNLVFTQYDKQEDGTYALLPKPNIDTGMGLERTAMVMQEEDSLFDIDTVKRILNACETLSGKKYKQDSQVDIALRGITDHVRAASFMISEGILPSNEGRGYILRRLIRRASRLGKLIGLEKPFLHQLTDVCIEQFQDFYQELIDNQETIRKVMMKEEEKFGETLDQGMQILNTYIAECQKIESSVLSGKKTFELFATYGFPKDLTKEILAERAMTFDEKVYEEEMRKHKQLGKESWQGNQDSAWNKTGDMFIKELPSTHFMGYDALMTHTEIVAMMDANQTFDKAVAGQKVTIVLEKTPFYAQSGGQVADTGFLKGLEDDFEMLVLDVTKTEDGKILHICEITHGEVYKGAKVVAKVNEDVRKSTERNHSATHLLHKALKEILGNHVHQAGSLVMPEKLRFDFTHFEAMTQDELERVEQRVNENIFHSHSVNIEEMPLEEAKKKGAMALFSEKYKDVVRVVDISPYSLELCGGCHVKQTSEIGLFKIISETGIASGVRRIEAISGAATYAYLNQLQAKCQSIAGAVKAPISEIDKRVEGLVQEQKAVEREYAKLKQQMLMHDLDERINKALIIQSIPFLFEEYKGLQSADMRSIGDRLKDKIGQGVVVITNKVEEKMQLLVMVDAKTIKKGVHAGHLVKKMAEVLGGSGGGRPDMAQAGGSQPSKLKDAFLVARQYLEEKLA